MRKKGDEFWYIDMPGTTWSHQEALEYAANNKPKSWPRISHIPGLGERWQTWSTDAANKTMDEMNNKLIKMPPGLSSTVQRAKLGLSAENFMSWKDNSENSKKFDGMVTVAPDWFGHELFNRSVTPVTSFTTTNKCDPTYEQLAKVECEALVETNQLNMPRKRIRVEELGRAGTTTERLPPGHMRKLLGMHPCREWQKWRDDVWIPQSRQYRQTAFERRRQRIHNNAVAAASKKSGACEGKACCRKVK